MKKKATACGGFFFGASEKLIHGRFAVVGR